MKVETYEVTETTNEAEALAHDAASIELIEKLGLVGQRSLTNKETQTLCPYRAMTKDEQFVYQHICPERSEPKNYAGGPIPLRVLQILAWAQDNSIFKRLEIWSANSATIKDPVLVGYIQDTRYSWQDNLYILARWADELLPIEVLLPDAYKIYITKRKSRAIKQRAEADRDLAEISTLENQVHVPESF